MGDVVGLDLSFSRQDLKAALVVSFLSVLVLVGLFYYLNRYTNRRYFSFWALAWVFYALWLALCVGLQNVPDIPWSITVKEWCIGASAVFQLWGSAWFLHRRPRPAQLVLFLGFLCLWSYLGAHGFESPLQAQIPVFGLIGLVSQVTAGCFYCLRRQKKFLGSGLLTAGFSLWGIHLAASPFLQSSEQLISADFFISAVLQLFIAVSMIILVLEEVRHTNQLTLQLKIVSTEERYRSLFDQASEGIVIADAEELRILELNQTAKRLLGIASGDVSRASLSSFCRLHPDSRPGPRTGREWFAAICRHRHLNLVRRDGGVIPAEVDGAPIGFEGRAAFQFFLRELTERARLEQQLRQAEKLSALGQMISGIAHELNNPLAAVKGYVELILTRHELAELTRRDLEKVASESNRAAKLVNNFLSFARQQPMQREALQLNDLVLRVVDLRKFDHQKLRVELRLNLDPDLAATQADPDQIQQVLVNLLNNALDALATAARPGILQITTRQTDNLIAVMVEDNGPGVPAEMLPFIFEPFFTTKEVGKGTGLGLSIAHSVLADHNGRVFYQPSALGGACFVFELPIVSGPRKDEPDSLSPAIPTAPASRALKSGKILVLDDERSIAELVGEMLGMIGHSTVICQSALEALEIIDQREFDLIISDFRMPKMNGQEFYHAVRDKKPELASRMIFLTGDVVNEDTQSFLRTTGNPHLTKPFQLARIEEIVTEMLQRNLTPTLSSVTAPQ